MNIEVLQSTGQQSDYSQVNNFGFSALNIGASSIGVTVNITEARETSTSQVDTRFKQEGITVSIGGGVVQAVQTDTARGSSVTAGGNATIGATRIAGASKDSAQDSNLTLQGSTVQAKGTTSLSADNAVFLLASANTAKQSSSQSSSSSSIGIDTNANFTLGANSGSGDGKGVDISYNNTQVGGKTVQDNSNLVQYKGGIPYDGNGNPIVIKK